jgi:hypothetical protein
LMASRTLLIPSFLLPLLLLLALPSAAVAS